MRIISQSGMFDLPYEQVGISIRTIKSNMIIAYPISDSPLNDAYWMIAEYSTPEKAKKAMEMLRDCCVARYMIQLAENEARVESLAELGIEEFAKQAVFQFPQDEEIEV